MIFTKRSTSIIASGEDIYPHQKFTESLDYEGEIGVIIGKAGFMIDESNAMDHVWGYTIVNGESCDISTFCSGPEAHFPVEPIDTSDRCDRTRKAERPQAILYRQVC